MPKNGFTEIVAGILDHENIEVCLYCAFETLDKIFVHIFYSGPLDQYFECDLGRVGYRALDFEEIRAKGDLQGTAVMNYCDESVPYTRISEHKHFAPWESAEFEGTVAFKEYSRACGPDDAPYYPIRLVNDKKVLDDYEQRASQEKGVTFVGRLGTYQYLDIDVTIERT